MAQKNETPRQKMIGMMYLVLMAMLAINVSSEVLDTFNILNRELDGTKNKLEQTNANVLDEFAQQLSINQSKAENWHNLAMRVHQQSEDIVAFIENKKLEILKEANEDTEELVQHGQINWPDIKAKDNIDAPASVMIGAENNKAGKELKGMLDHYREYLLTEIYKGNDVSEATIESVRNCLNTDHVKDEKTGDIVVWERANFENLPMVGVLSILTSIQISVRNAEAESLKRLYEKIDQHSFKFNKLEANVHTNSNYIIEGNKLKAELFLAACDTTARPVAYITKGNQPYDSIINKDGSVSYSLNSELKYDSVSGDNYGRAFYEFDNTTPGTYNWGGIIEMKGQENTIRRPFRSRYVVSPGMASVALPRMNVFYLGLKNPVEVSVPGIPPEEVEISVTNGRAVSLSRNSYNIVPNDFGRCQVYIFTTTDGVRKQVDKKTFRVKQVPSPVATLFGKKGGVIRRQEVLAAGGISSLMENFEYDTKFEVLSFKLSVSIRPPFLTELEAESAKFTSDQRKLINQFKSGQVFYIEDIIVRGEDRLKRELPLMKFTIR